MTERMRDDVLAVAEVTADKVRVEIHRARSEEARLLEENRVLREALKAAEEEAKRRSDASKYRAGEDAKTIAALAEALEGTSLGADLKRGPCWCRAAPHADWCDKRRTALRLAGRLS